MRSISKKFSRRHSAADDPEDPDYIPPMRRFAAKALIAAAVTAIWTVLYPTPYALCVGLVAIFPLAAVAIVGLSRGQLKFVNPAGEITTYALLIILVTGGALAYRSLDICALSWAGPAFAAAMLGLGFTGAVAWIDRPNLHKRLLVTVLAFGLVWGWGCADFANALFDTAPKQTFRPAIGYYTIALGSNAGRTGGGGRSRHLVVGPWGPITKTDDPVVSETLYQRAEHHQPICITLGRGFLGAPWYSLGAC
jgi:hypothetical protein